MLLVKRLRESRKNSIVGIKYYLRFFLSPAEMPVILFISHLASIKSEINFYFHDYENIPDNAIARVYVCVMQIKRKIGKKFYFYKHEILALRLYPT